MPEVFDISKGTNFLLSDAQSFVKKNLQGEGSICPCCNQMAKMYRRPITSSMAYGLYLMYKEYQNTKDFIHIERFFKRKDIPSSIRGDIPKLRFWGLIEMKQNIEVTPAGKNKGEPVEGFYKVTAKGVDFIENKITVPCSVWVYNNTPYDFEGKEVSIKDCFKKKFDYDKLIKNTL